MKSANQELGLEQVQAIGRKVVEAQLEALRKGASRGACEVVMGSVAVVAVDEADRKQEPAEDLVKAMFKGLRARLNVMAGEAAMRGDHDLAKATGSFALAVADELEARR